MNKFLNQLEITNNFENIKTEAKDFIIVVTPNLDANHWYYHDLLKKFENGVKVIFISNNKRIPKNLLSLKNKAEFYYHENIYSNVLINENKIIFRSTVFGGENYLEQAIIFDRNMDEDEISYFNTKQQILNLINSSTVILESSLFPERTNIAYDANGYVFEMMKDTIELILGKPLKKINEFTTFKDLKFTRNQKIDLLHELDQIFEVDFPEKEIKNLKFLYQIMEYYTFLENQNSSLMYIKRPLHPQSIQLFF